MLDLIAYFKELDNLSLEDSKNKFNNDILQSGNDKVIIVGKNAYYYENIPNMKYLNYRCFQCGAFEFTPKYYKRCRCCAQYIMSVKFNMILNCEFYVYNTDRLIIIQNIDDKPIAVNKIYLKTDANKWIPLMWVRNSYLILSIFQMQLPLDLKRCLMALILKFYYLEYS